MPNLPTPTQNFDALIGQSMRCSEMVRATPQSSAHYDGYCSQLRGVLQELGIHDTLAQLHDHGPVEDGDVINKAHRNFLIDLGLASRVVVRGKQGYTALNYTGSNVYKGAVRP